MRYLFSIVLLVAMAISSVNAQELYVFSEPASNMSAKSIGVRMTSEGFINPEFKTRILPEVMVGFNKNLMVHVQGFLSDMDGKFKAEGGRLYAKYRFYSADALQSHFRMAAFGQLSTSNRPVYTEDINLEGDNSGFGMGLIATQLLHKLALSGTLGYTKAFERKEDRKSVV